MSITIASRHLVREFADGADGFVTTRFATATGVELTHADVSREGSVTFGETTYRLGGKGEGALPYQGHTVSELNNDGQRLEVVFGGAEGLPSGLQVKAIYEAPDAVPVLIKQIRIDNESGAAVKLEGITVEEFTPLNQPEAAILFESDYVADAITVDGKRAYFPWIEHHHYYVDALLTCREAPTRFAYPVNITRWIPAGSRFNSLKAFEFVLPNQNREARGVALKQATRTLWPWSAATYLSICVSPRDGLKNYYRAIDQAAEAGLDLVELRHIIDNPMRSPLFTNFSDYELDRERFPGGWADVRKLTDYAHGKGLKVGFYTIYVNTWQGPYSKGPGAMTDNNWELQWSEDHVENHSMPPDGDGLRWGPALDPATDWGLYINRRMEEVVRKGGFDMYVLDGPYYGDVSVADTFRGVPPGGPNQVLGWERQVAFYQTMSAMGILGEAAQGFHAFPHGMGRITTTGYHEGDFDQMQMHEQILSTRKGAYHFTYAYRSEQAITYIPVCAAVESNPNCPSMEPLEENADIYDAYLANCYGYGFEGKLHCNALYEGPKSRAVLQRWVSFWRDHEPFFKQGFLLHLREPDGERIDGIIHVIPGESPRALAVVYNPTDQELSDTLSLEVLDDIGLPTTDWQVVSESGEQQSVKDAKLSVMASPRNATWYKLKRCA